MRDRLRRRHLRLLAMLAGVLVVMAVGAGVALAVSLGTAGELNYQYRFLTADGNSFDEGTVRCPSGRHVTGGGVAPGTPSMDVQATFPRDGSDGDEVPDDSWFVRVENPLSGQVTYTAYAICDN